MKHKISHKEEVEGGEHSHEHHKKKHEHHKKLAAHHAMHMKKTPKMHSKHHKEK
jgi:hypothetical protein